MAVISDTKNLKLSVTNFGPIVRAEIDLRPLTVFVGPSNTGKSYLAILIYALHRFFSGDAIGPSFREGGPKGSVFYPRDWIGGKDRGGNREISEGELNILVSWLRQGLEEAQAQKKYLHAPIPDAIAVLIRALLRDVSTLGNLLSDEISRCFGIVENGSLIRYMTKKGARIDLSRQVAGNAESLEPFSFNFAMKRKIVEFNSSIPESTPLQMWVGKINEPLYERSLKRLDSFLSEYLHSESVDRNIVARILIGSFADFVGADIVNPLSRPAHYLPSDRTGVMHAHRVLAGSAISYVSRAGSGRLPSGPALSGVIADFFRQFIGLGDLRSGRGADDTGLAERLESDMLQGRILGENSDIGFPEFYYQPEEWKEKIPLMNSSSMVSELAPVVLYLRHIVQPGDVLIIEEPESHLHPAMQIEFIRQLAGVVRSGIRVMLTTHSEWVLEELAYLIRLSELPKSGRVGIDSGDFALKPHEVGLWRFDSKKRPNGTVVKEIQLDPEIGNFESGYDDVAISVHNKWAEVSNLIEERRVQ